MGFDHPSGSVWHKWDLHAHTPLDAEWTEQISLATEKEKLEFAKRYVATAVERGLSGIAITDHNFCQSTDHLLIPQIMAAAKDVGLTVLPGFEITVSDCNGTHLLVLFPEQTRMADIDAIMCQLFPPGSQRFESRRVMQTAKNAEEMHQILENSGLQSLLIFAHADTSNGALDSAKQGEQRIQLWQSPFVGIAQIGKDPAKANGFLGNVATGVCKEYARPIAYVMASDCRQLELSTVAATDRYGLGERFTWIKAAPTFEGLKQIVFEPKERVRLQPHRPEQKLDSLVMKSIRFIDENGRFQPEFIPLNPNLTAIIGGKSTGKSVLLSSIAHTVDPDEVARVSKIAGPVFVFNNLELEVTWGDNSRDQLTTPLKKHRITFLPQMYIHKLVEGQNLGALSDTVLSFLRQNEDFDNDYKACVKAGDEASSQLQAAIESVLLMMPALDDTTAKLRELGDRDSIMAELKKNAEKKEAMRQASGFTAEENTLLAERLSETTKLAETVSQSKRIEAAFTEAEATVHALLDPLVQQVGEIAPRLQLKHSLPSMNELELSGIFAALAGTLASGSAEFSKSAETRRRAAESLRIQAEARGREILEELSPVQQKVQNQAELAELEKSEASMKGTLEAIEVKLREKEELDRELARRVATITSLLAQNLEAKQRLARLARDCERDTIGNDFTIAAELEFAHDRFELFLNLFDRRISLDWLGVALMGGRLQWSEQTHVALLSQMLNVLLSRRGDAPLRAQRSFQEAVRLLASDFLNVRLTVQQNGETISEMSPGKQGLVLLELFLHLNTAQYPILIDQPEDNLDNRTIFTQLAGFIRRKKIDRQIIIVTHNPNLVVGADAEEVIVGNQDGERIGQNLRYRFEYVSGGLECSFENPAAASLLLRHGIRQHVCEVLEGGLDAFAQRERKYDLRRAVRKQ